MTEPEDDIEFADTIKQRTKSECAVSISTPIGKLRPIQLHFEDLKFSVPIPKKKRSKSEEGKTPNEYKMILKGINGTVNPGTLLAIIGSSGAGKTTLLNVLAGRSNGKMEGKLLFNGHSVKEAKALTKKAAYIMQDDILMKNQTPREILNFASLLRIPHGYTNGQKRERVEELIRELNLANCQNTRVGAPGLKRGISGGERKRVAIGNEIINNPSLLFVDEPTSGLDSFTAETVMQSLRDLAISGRTIVCTIHQPNSDIFELFDQLMLLADGQVVYYGAANKAIEYFASIGYPCRSYVNPPDFFIKLVHIDQSDPESKRRVQKLIDAYRESEIYKKQREVTPNFVAIEESTEDDEESYPQGFFSQFGLLAKRNFIDTLREPLKTRAKLGQTIFLGLIMGLIYLQLGNDQGSSQDRLGALFFILVNQTMGSIMGVVTLFPGERAIFFREHGNHMYRTSAFFLAKVFSDIIWQLFFPLLFSTISYWLMGFQNDVEKFLIFCAISTLIANVGGAIGFFLGILVKDAGVAVALTPVTLIPFMIFSGFLINTKNVPVYFLWIEYISFFKYAFRGIVVNEFTGLKFTCEENEKMPGPAGPSCRINTGEDVIKTLGFDDSSIEIDLLVLLGMYLFLITAAYFCLLIRAKKQKNA